MDRMSRRSIDPECREVFSNLNKSENRFFVCTVSVIKVTSRID